MLSNIGHVKIQFEEKGEKVNFFKKIKVEENVVSGIINYNIYQKLINDNSYTKITDNELREFSSGHSSDVYKIIMRYLNIGKTCKFTVSWFKKILNIKDYSYKFMSNFKSLVIDKVLEDLKNKFNLIIECKIIKRFGESFVQFFIINRDDVKKINEFGLDSDDLNSIKKNYGEDVVNEACEQLKNSKAFRGHKIRNKRSYLLKIIDNLREKVMSSGESKKAYSDKDLYDKIKLELQLEYEEHLQNNISKYLRDLSDSEVEHIKNALMNDTFIKGSPWFLRSIENDFYNFNLWSQIINSPAFNKISHFFLTFTQYCGRFRKEKTDELQRFINEKGLRARDL